MKKIAILKSRIAYLGGLEKYAQEIAKAFLKNGCQVTILTTGKPIHIDQIEVISLCPHQKNVCKLIPNFEKKIDHFLSKNPQDIVFGLDRTKYQTHYRAGNGVHNSFLEHKKNSFFKKLYHALSQKHRFINKVEKNLFESSKLKLIVVNSKKIKDELTSTFSLDPSKIEVVHNGFDEKKYTFSKNNDLKKTTLQLLFVGHNYKRKGLELTLRTLAEFPNKDFQLIVIGKDKNISYYKSLSKKLSLDHKVLFLGSQNDLSPFYQRADIFILPTSYDPFSNVVVEALSMGNYVITSSSNGASEIINSTSGEIISNLNSIDELKASFEKAFKKDFSSELKSQIRKSVKHLSLDNQLLKLTKLSLEYA